MIATVAGNMVAYMHAYSLLFVCVYAILLDFFFKIQSNEKCSRVPIGTTCFTHSQLEFHERKKSITFCCWRCKMIKTVHCCCCCLYFHRCFHREIRLFSFVWCFRIRIYLIFGAQLNNRFAKGHFCIDIAHGWSESTPARSINKRNGSKTKIAWRFSILSFFFFGKTEMLNVCRCIYLCCMCHTQLSCYAYHSLTHCERV